MSETPDHEGDLPYGIGSNTLPGLAKLVEEGGELLQVLGKIMAVGSLDVPHWDEKVGAPRLGERLINELGDLKAAINYFAAANDIGMDVDDRAEDKHALFWRWHHDAQGTPLSELNVTTPLGCNNCNPIFDDLNRAVPAEWPNGACPKCGYDGIPF